MDITAALSPVNRSTAYVAWEEVFASTAKGEREVRYNLKKIDGTSDLVVIGEEKSSNRISYRYTIQNSSLFSSRTNLKSRSEVVDWLNSNVKDLHTPLLADGSEIPRNNDEADFKKFKLHDQPIKEILWLGSPWKCEKRRKHYSSFIRNGVKISVNDFVYVLAEEDQRLVAYLKDLYEDTKGNKMVIVQWFHKITEVSIVLPSCTQTESTDREIFFSLCTQRLSIECIDGLATVLAPQQLEKYKNGPAHCQLDPYVCHKQFDNGEVKPFDITQVKGYWNQKIFQYMFTSLLSKEVNSQQFNVLSTEENFNRIIPSVRPKKKQRLFTESDVVTQSAVEVDLMPVRDANILNPSEVTNVKKSFPDASLSRIDAINFRSTQYVAVGSQIEVLSQDSGIKGCWFRALVIKKHNDRIKVRYLELTDPENEANNVEEWILSSKVAAPDKLGVRSDQRKSTRPVSRSNKSKVSRDVDVGTAVDAWWHDGWWEGIVIRKESEEKIHVYFPEEKKESVFSRDDLRQCHEWVENRWTQIKDRPELVTELISNLEAKLVVVDSYKDGKSTPKALGDSFKSRCGDSKVVVDLSKDDLLTQLKWNSRKRRRDRIISVQKLDYNDSNSKQCPKASGLRKYEKFFVSSPMKVNPQNCKHIGEPITSASVVPHHHKSMVMSR